MSKKSENSKKTYKKSKNVSKLNDDSTIEVVSNVEEVIDDNVVEEESVIVEETVIENEPVTVEETAEESTETVVEENKQEEVVKEEDNSVKKISKKNTRYNPFSSVWNGVEIDFY